MTDLRIGKEQRAAPWRCDLCGAGDNATRYRNPFTVTLDGERCAPDDPEVGEDIDDLVLELSLCDRCSRAPDVRLRILRQAARLEHAALRATAKGALSSGLPDFAPALKEHVRRSLKAMAFEPPECPECHGRPVQSQLAIGPLTVTSSCAVCGGSGQAHALSVAQLLAHLHMMIESGQVSQHAGVIVQVHRRDGFDHHPMELARVHRFEEVDGVQVAFTIEVKE